jgi:DNA polymerase III delta prime subunit
MKHVVWAEKYRPSKVADCVLPKYVQGLVRNILDTGVVPNLLLVGSSGLGKTTLAKAICAELDLDFMMLNASIGGQESGIDALRNNIMRFASTVSMLSDKRKMIIFDEADNLSSSVQPALRNFMEEYSATCGFVLTCNYPQKIIDAIHSRCTVVDFGVLVMAERQDLMKQTFSRLGQILEDEGVRYDKQIVAAVIKEHFPDIRHMLNSLQGYAKGNNGVIDKGILALHQDSQFDEVIDALKNKKWNAVRDWVFSQPNVRPEVYSKLYKALEQKVAAKSRPALIIILNEHQDKATRVVDKGMCLLAALTELMSNCEMV